jgi:pseudaminic acid cytidylyltransferase
MRLCVNSWHQLDTKPFFDNGIFLKMQKHMRVAVIPARGGSKRIPRKNIKPFCGRPMIAWSIDAAKASGCFDRIIVSTDDDEIAGVARECGADVPFLRPASLANDYVGTIPVIAHAIGWVQSQGESPNAVCCIYATAPFLCAEDICKGLQDLELTGADYAFSVTRYEFPIQRAVRIVRSGRVQMLFPENFDTRSQDLEETYHDAAQFYWGRTSAWFGGKAIFSEAATPVVLPRHRVQDIDTPEDWERAEWMFKSMATERKH